MNFFYNTGQIAQRFLILGILSLAIVPPVALAQFPTDPVDFDPLLAGEFTTNGVAVTSANCAGSVGKCDGIIETRFDNPAINAGTFSVDVQFRVRQAKNAAAVTFQDISRTVLGNVFSDVGQYIAYNTDTFGQNVHAVTDPTCTFATDTTNVGAKATSKVTNNNRAQVVAYSFTASGKSFGFGNSAFDSFHLEMPSDNYLTIFTMTCSGLTNLTGKAAGMSFNVLNYDVGVTQLYGTNNVVNWMTSAGNSLEFYPMDGSNYIKHASMTADGKNVLVEYSADITPSANSVTFVGGGETPATSSIQLDSKTAWITFASDIHASLSTITEANRVTSERTVIFSSTSSGFSADFSNKASYRVVMPRAYDLINDPNSPTITGIEVAANESYIDVSFSEAVSGSQTDDTVALDTGSFEVSWYGTTNAPAITAIQEVDGSGNASAISGSASKVRLTIDLASRSASGNSSMLIRPAFRGNYGDGFISGRSIYGATTVSRLGANIGTTATDYAVGMLPLQAAGLVSFSNMVTSTLDAQTISEGDAATNNIGTLTVTRADSVGAETIKLTVNSSVSTTGDIELSGTGVTQGTESGTWLVALADGAITASVTVAYTDSSPTNPNVNVTYTISVAQASGSGGSISFVIEDDDNAPPVVTIQSITISETSVDNEVGTAGIRPFSAATITEADGDNITEIKITLNNNDWNLTNGFNAYSSVRSVSGGNVIYTYTGSENAAGAQGYLRNLRLRLNTAEFTNIASFIVTVQATETYTGSLTQSGSDTETWTVQAENDAVTGVQAQTSLALQLGVNTQTNQSLTVATDVTDGGDSGDSLTINATQTSTGTITYSGSPFSIDSQNRLIFSYDTSQLSGVSNATGPASIGYMIDVVDTGSSTKTFTFTLAVATNALPTFTIASQTISETAVENNGGPIQLFQDADVNTLTNESADTINGVTIDLMGDDNWVIASSSSLFSGTSETTNDNKTQYTYTPTSNFDGSVTATITFLRGLTLSLNADEFESNSLTITVSINEITSANDGSLDQTGESQSNWSLTLVNDPLQVVTGTLSLRRIIDVDVDTASTVTVATVEDSDVQPENDTNDVTVTNVTKTSAVGTNINYSNENAAFTIQNGQLLFAYNPSNLTGQGSVTGSEDIMFTVTLTDSSNGNPADTRDVSFTLTITNDTIPPVLPGDQIITVTGVQATSMTISWKTATDQRVANTSPTASVNYALLVVPLDGSIGGNAGSAVQLTPTILGVTDLTDINQTLTYKITRNAIALYPSNSYMITLTAIDDAQLSAVGSYTPAMQQMNSAVDNNGNGIEDSLENTTGASCSAQDQDGDGVSNATEIRFGRDCSTALTGENTRPALSVARISATTETDAFDSVADVLLARTGIYSDTVPLSINNTASQILDGAAGADGDGANVQSCSGCEVKAYVNVRPATYDETTCRLSADTSCVQTANANGNIFLGTGYSIVEWEATDSVGNQAWEKQLVYVAPLYINQGRTSYTLPTTGTGTVQTQAFAFTLFDAEPGKTGPSISASDFSITGDVSTSSVQVVGVATDGTFSWTMGGFTSAGQSAAIMLNTNSINGGSGSGVNVLDIAAHQASQYQLTFDNNQHAYFSVGIRATNGSSQELRTISFSSAPSEETAIVTVNSKTTIGGTIIENIPGIIRPIGALNSIHDTRIENAVSLTRSEGDSSVEITIDYFPGADQSNTLTTATVTVALQKSASATATVLAALGRICVFTQSGSVTQNCSITLTVADFNTHNFAQGDSLIITIEPKSNTGSMLGGATGKTEITFPLANSLSELTGRPVTGRIFHPGSGSTGLLFLLGLSSLLVISTVARRLRRRAVQLN